MNDQSLTGIVDIARESSFKTALVVYFCWNIFFFNVSLEIYFHFYVDRLLLAPFRSALMSFPTSLHWRISMQSLCKFYANSMQIYLPSLSNGQFFFDSEFNFSPRLLSSIVSGDPFCDYILHSLQNLINLYFYN